MHNLEVDEQVWEELQSLAKPLVDTPNTVLRRVLGIREKTKSGSVSIRKAGEVSRIIRNRTYERTPQTAYREPILQVLHSMGGSGKVSAILAQVESMLRTTLNFMDKMQLPIGNDIRWRSAAQWERQKMVGEGLLKNDSPRGTWALTESGMEKAEDLSPGD